MIRFESAILHGMIYICFDFQCTLFSWNGILKYIFSKLWYSKSVCYGVSNFDKYGSCVKCHISCCSASMCNVCTHSIALECNLSSHIGVSCCAISQISVTACLVYVSQVKMSLTTPHSGMIVGLHPAKERQRYFIMSYLIGWVQA